MDWRVFKTKVKLLYSGPVGEYPGGNKMNEMVTHYIIDSSLYGQGFGYNYIDPCNQQVVNLNYKTETTENGFWVTYYNQRRFFTWLEVADGTLQNWTQQVYQRF